MKTTRLHLRLNEDDISKIQHMADDEDLSCTELIENRIRQAYEDYSDGILDIPSGRLSEPCRMTRSVSMKVDPEVYDILNTLAFYCSDSKNGVIRKLLNA